MAPLKVGIAGLGTVGAEVVRLIENESRTLSARCGRGVRVVAVTARSKAKKRSLDLSGVAWAKDPVSLASSPDIDCFVELMGGSGEPALSAVETALKAGKSVVTANKALIAKHGIRLAQAAEKHGGALNFEAAVGAAIPVIKTLREGLPATGVNRVYGILNGTCNYILTRMEQEGLSFAECLKDAQRLGYAEANPSFDVDGHDTAQKLAILASLAFGTRVAQSAVYVEGISSIAPEDLRAASDLGYRVKLLGVATASAVLADIADVARGVRVNPFGRPVDRLRATVKAPMERHEGGYYIRLMARDLPGTAATIATRLAEQKISIESIVQRHPNGTDAEKGSPVPVLLITYATHEDAVHRALAAVQKDKVISGRPQVIRIEKN
jgi:homoserine dehydrogenase